MPQRGCHHAAGFSLSFITKSHQQREKKQSEGRGAVAVLLHLLFIFLKFRKMEKIDFFLTYLLLSSPVLSVFNFGEMASVSLRV
jgi:hypothetical protein